MMRALRRTGWLALALHLAVTASASARPIHTVRLLDSRFDPPALSLSVGARVRFVWRGELVHNLLGPGVPRAYATPRRRHRPLTLRLRRRGTLLYYCSIHPGMNTVLRVK